MLQLGGVARINGLPESGRKDIAPCGSMFPWLKRSSDTTADPAVYFNVSYSFVLFLFFLRQNEFPVEQICQIRYIIE
jgi:hypothetical protein